MPASYDFESNIDTGCLADQSCRTESFPRWNTTCFCMHLSFITTSTSAVLHENILQILFRCFHQASWLWVFHSAAIYFTCFRLGHILLIKMTSISCIVKISKISYNHLAFTLLSSCFHSIYYIMLLWLISSIFSFPFFYISSHLLFIHLFYSICFPWYVSNSFYPLLIHSFSFNPSSFL